jgi:hypothetical protein
MVVLGMMYATPDHGETAKKQVRVFPASSSSRESGLKIEVQLLFTNVRLYCPYTQVEYSNLALDQERNKGYDLGAVLETDEDAAKTEAGIRKLECAT